MALFPGGFSLEPEGSLKGFLLRRLISIEETQNSEGEVARSPSRGERVPALQIYPCNALRNTCLLLYNMIF